MRTAFKIAFQYQRTRQAEENKIAQLVTSNNFDGIDIDFEAMYAADASILILYL